MALSIIVTSGLPAAQAVLIEPSDHWKYRVDEWIWDPDLRRSMGLIKPQIIIQNETAGRIDGYIADVNGTRLDFFKGEQFAMASFGYDNGVVSKWELADAVIDGYFTIEIPDSHKEADFVRIYIGNNQYTVNDGTATTPQTWVFTNSARMDYRLNATVQQPDTVIAANETKPAEWKPSPNSLIDRILMMYSLSVRSADPGK